MVGVVVGVVAGVVAAAFLTVAAQPSVEAAIRIEEAAAAAHGHGHEDGTEVVSRAVQRGPGLFGAYALTGAGFGALLGTVFVVAGRRRGG
ncbi:MAG TPA: CbtA family protein, partial [Acidimicrobiales bacterium]|nr:CbtA family protein [Acidimicrobiales bacterium]